MKPEIPKDRSAGLRQNWRTDLTSGAIVCLIALPLCLGIAVASGVPPMAGLITAIIGGLFVPWISGSHVTINGPAAGLIVVTLGAVESLGQGDPLAGYRSMLAAVVVSGLLLFLLGRLKAGKVADLFPSSAVQGMLAAIGVMVIAAQAHVMLGVEPEGKVPLALLAEIPKSLITFNPDIAIIGAVSLAILGILPLIRNRYVSMIPAPVVAVLVGVALGHCFDLQHEHSYLFADHHTYTIGPKFLVTLPSGLTDALMFPDWSKMFTIPFVMAVVSITLVQGLGTLLSVRAVDKLDPYRRQSDLNKDLGAVGVGSAISCSIGGLPMIAEVVRSSANVNNGGRTQWANFFHGALLLILVVAFPALLHRIPLATLAAILVNTGYRLATPRHFIQAFHNGVEQFAIFCTTLVVTLLTDLIIGVAVGMLLELMLNMVFGTRVQNLFKPALEVVESAASGTVVHVHRSAIFSNYPALKKRLDRVPNERPLSVRFDRASLVDHTVMENLYTYKEVRERNGGRMTIEGLGHLVPRSSYPMASRHSKKDPG